MMHARSVEEDKESDNVSEISEFEGNDVNELDFLQVASVTQDKSEKLSELFITEEVTYSPNANHVPTDSK